MPDTQMRFAVVAAFVPADQLIPLAIAADELGYDSFGLADHVVDFQTLETPYPYTPDGARRWEIGADWPDPWVTIGALGAVTKRIRFLTSVYVPAIRSPFTVAKAVGTAAALSGGRVTLGVGVGWCREEFQMMGEAFHTRGSRTDEALDLMHQLWTEEWVKSDGPHYPTPPVTMRPLPGPIPVVVGGLSEVALRRAARFDGWVGDIYSTDQAAGFAARLRELRPEDAPPPQVIVALNDAFLPEHFATAAERGVTEVITQPWYFYSGPDATLEQKIESLHRFKADVLDPLRGTA